MNLLFFLVVILTVFIISREFFAIPRLLSVLFALLSALLLPPVISWFQKHILVRLGWKQLKGYLLRIIHKELKAVEAETVETIEILKESIEKESFGHKILQSKLKIEFSDEISETDEKALREGEKVVVILNYALRDRFKTFVKALWLYVQKEFLPTTSRFFDKDLIFSMRYFVAINILRQKGYKYVETFREYIERVKDNFPESSKWLPKLENIYENGFFFTILLHELIKSVEVRQFKETDPVLKEEFQVRFLDFLDIIATKEPGEDVPLSFNGKIFKVSVILVMKQGKKTVAPHVRRVKEELGKGTTVYLAASEHCKDEFWYAIQKLENDGINPITQPVVFKSQRHRRKFLIACFEP